MDTPPEVTALGMCYLGTYLLGAPLIFGFFAIDAAFRASGDTRTPFLSARDHGDRGARARPGADPRAGAGAPARHCRGRSRDDRDAFRGVRDRRRDARAPADDHAWAAWTSTRCAHRARRLAHRRDGGRVQRCVRAPHAHDDPLRHAGPRRARRRTARRELVVHDRRRLRRAPRRQSSDRTWERDRRSAPQLAGWIATGFATIDLCDRGGARVHRGAAIRRTLHVGPGRGGRERSISAHCGGVHAVQRQRARYSRVRWAAPARRCRP